MTKIIVDIAVALFAVYGFYCALRMLADLLWAPKQLCVAVRVQTREDADMLDVLLHEADSAFFANRRASICVLVSAALMDGTIGLGDELFDPYAELLEEYNADCYLIDL